MIDLFCWPASMRVFGHTGCFFFVCVSHLKRSKQIWGLDYGDSPSASTTGFLRKGCGRSFLTWLMIDLKHLGSWYSYRLDHLGIARSHYSMFYGNESYWLGKVCANSRNLRALRLSFSIPNLRVQADTLQPPNTTRKFIFGLIPAVHRILPLHDRCAWNSERKPW